MPIHRSIDNKSNLVTLVCSGTLIKGSIKAAFLEMLDDPEFRPGANVLWDFRGIQAEPPREQDILMFAAMVRENQARRGSGYKVAMIVDKDLYYGLIRMYQAYSDELPSDVKIFRSMEEASEWLAEKKAV